MIVGTKRSIAPYKEDERKVDDGIARTCAYACARMRVAITPTSRRIEIPDGSSQRAEPVRTKLCEKQRNTERRKGRKKCLSIGIFTNRPFQFIEVLCVVHEYNATYNYMYGIQNNAI